MINEGLLKDYNIGKDGFIWWLGQVCEAKTWEHNYPCLPVNTQKDLPGFKKLGKGSVEYTKCIAKKGKELGKKGLKKLNTDSKLTDWIKKQINK